MAQSTYNACRPYKNDRPNLLQMIEKPNIQIVPFVGFALGKVVNRSETTLSAVVL